MDDHTFDDLIKKKLGDYEDPVFDPTSLAAMRERLAGLRPTPWYAQTASRLFVVSSVVFFALINAYILKTALVKVVPSSQPLPVAAVWQESVVDSLNRVVARMKCELEQASDVAVLAQQHAVYRKSVPTFVVLGGHPDSPDEIGYKINIGSVSEIPVEVYYRLKQQGLLTVENGQGYVMLYSRSSMLAQNRDLGEELKLVTLEIVKPRPPRFILVNSIEVHDQSPAQRNKAGLVSLATQKALEKHYFRGIGIDIAPHIDAVKGIFKNGSGEITPRIGITADWVLSPSLSVETGLDYLTTVAHLDLHSGNFVNHHDNPQFGPPQSISLYSSLGSMPVAIKYRQWISSRNQAVLKFGITPYASLKNEYQFTYQYSDNSPDHDLIKVTTLDRHNDFRYFGTTMTAALGLMSMRTKNKDKFESSLFYERTLGRAGDERHAMQLVGLRAAYWFKIK